MNLRTATLTSPLLIFLVGLYSLWIYPALPAQIPTHWNLNGEIDGWMPKGAAILFLLGTMGVLLALMLGAQWLSPRRFDTAPFRQTFHYIMVLVLGLMGFIGIVMFQAALHPNMDSGRVVIAGLMLFFTVLSNTIGKVRRNFWVGVRTPWTLASERVWIATHRLAARLWIVAGLILTLAVLLGAPTTPVFVLLMVALFVPVFYSLWLYKRIQTSGPGPLLLLILVGSLLLPGSHAEAKVKTMDNPQQTNTTRELRFQGEGGFELQGTLLLPERAAKEKSAAVLLLPGSGPPDRDGNIKPALITNTLKQIAERLAKEGIASFRFDKRSAATYAAQWPKDVEKLDETFAWKAFLGDALTAYRLLRQQPEIEARRVGILGHSEGGLIALNLAHDLAGKPEAPAAVVLVATAGRPLDALVLEQTHTLLPKQIADKETLKTYLDYIDRAVPQVKKEKTLPPNTPQGLLGLFNPTVVSLLHSYFTMDPITFAAKYSGPALIVQGEKDTQVSATRDAPRLAEALKKRAGKVSELFLVPNASHNLKEVKSAEELGIAGPVVPAALDKIALWCKAHLGTS